MAAPAIVVNQRAPQHYCGKFYIRRKESFSNCVFLGVYFCQAIVPSCIMCLSGWLSVNDDSITNVMCILVTTVQ